MNRESYEKLVHRSLEECLHAIKPIISDLEVELICIENRGSTTISENALRSCIAILQDTLNELQVFNIIYNISREGDV